MQAAACYWLRRALSETPLTLSVFAESLGRHYEAIVPEHARHLSFVALDDVMPAAEWSRASARMVKTIQRYCADDDGHLHLPAELVPAWLMALPAPYGQNCRADLAQALGCQGVNAMEATSPSAGDLAGVSDLSTQFSQALGVATKMLEDGLFDRNDLPHLADLDRSLDQLVACSLALKARANQRITAEA